MDLAGALQEASNSFTSFTYKHLVPHSISILKKMGDSAQPEGNDSGRVKGTLYDFIDKGSVSLIYRNEIGFMGKTPKELDEWDKQNTRLSSPILPKIGYENGNEIAIAAAKNFLAVLTISYNNADSVKNVLRRYTIKDDFGEQDSTPALKRIQTLLERHVPEWGPIPGSDGVMLAITLASLLASDTEDEETSSDRLDGTSYENECLDELESAGYRVTLTPVNDQGADLIAEKDELQFAIQCKNHRRPVGNRAVQEAFAAKEYHNCDFAVVCSESAFTRSALEAGDKLNVILISKGDLYRLADLCEEYL